MSGERKLDNLLHGLAAELVDGVYVFATVALEDMPCGFRPRMTFREAEGINLILLRDEAEQHGLSYEFPCRMITLTVHSSLEAVGFIAHIATLFAQHGMPVNPVSGFFHDHLFILERTRDRSDGDLESYCQRSSLIGCNGKVHEPTVPESAAA